jgi:hypothetical protein
MIRNQRILMIVGLIALGLSIVLIVRTGCSGPPVKWRRDPPFQGVDPAEVEKVKAYIEKAGIRGQVVRIRPADGVYLVHVAEAPKNETTDVSKNERRRGQVAPVAPAPYWVNTKSGEVTPAM